MMSFVSRFLNPKPEDDDDFETLEEMPLDEEGGLLMAAPGRRAPQDDALAEIDVDIDEAAAPSTIGGEDERAAPPAAPTAPEEPVAPTQEEAAAEPPADQPPATTPAQVQIIAATAEAGGDDAIDIFRASKETGPRNTLTEHMENVPAQELLTELRELRQQLGIVAPVSTEDEP